MFGGSRALTRTIARKTAIPCLGEAAHAYMNGPTRMSSGERAGKALPRERATIPGNKHWDAADRLKRPDISDRKIPGNWEGDLIIDQDGASARIEPG